jgi:predicted deacylase
VRIVLPFIAAFACLIVASRLDAPVVGFVLFVVALGLVLDAGTALFARVTSTGGMRDHRQ